MELTSLQQQINALLSLGYSKEDIIKIVETAPAIFRYTPEGIKLIIDTFESTKEKIKQEEQETISRSF